MRNRAPIRIPATRFDVAVAHAVARRAQPGTERALRVVTALADERVLIAGTAAFWIGTRLARARPAMVRQADHLMLCTLASAALPHLFKKVVDRERPDRKVAASRRRRRGITQAGRPLDSFPSGHAVHLGALAAACGRPLRPALRPLVWSAAAALAATRVLLLAHYPTDVASGLAIGAALEALVRRVCRSGSDGAPP